MTTNPPGLDLEDAALDVHDEYHRAKACGFNTDLVICKFVAQEIAGRVRGISAIASLLAAENADGLSLGGYIRGGLLDALDLLSLDVTNRLEAANDRAEKAQAPSNPRARA